MDRDKYESNPEIDAQSLEAHRYVRWLLVELDAQLSFLLGRRPFIPSSHSIPQPSIYAERQEEMDLSEHARFLSLHGRNSRRDILRED